MRQGKDPNYRVVAIARPDTRIGRRASEDIHQQPPIRGGICGGICELTAMKAHEKQLVRR
jgi:hypothetical protein